jgi:acyl-CoA thioesterase-1
MSSLRRVRALYSLRAVSIFGRRRPRACHFRFAGLLVPVFALLLSLAACGGQSPASAPDRPIATATTAPVPPVIYVAMGASDAVGVGADNPNTQGYVPLLIKRLPTGSQALNLGIDGEELHRALNDELPEAIGAHPTLVTVWLAANDFRACVPLDQYTADLDTLLSQLQTQTRAHVFVANLPDMSLLPAMQNGAPGSGACLEGTSSAQIRAMVLQWNQAIASAVAQHGDVPVDLFNSTLAAHPEYIYRDGFHPSTAGYAVLASLFWAQIQAHDGVPQS